MTDTQQQVDDLYDLESRTWPQLRECAVTALPVLRKLAAEGSAGAAAALDEIAWILSAARAGPAPGAEKTP